MAGAGAAGTGVAAAAGAGAAAAGARAGVVATATATTSCSRSSCLSGLAVDCAVCASSLPPDEFPDAALSRSGRNGCSGGCIKQPR